MSAKPARTIVSLIMNVLIAVAIAITARIVVEFFGQLAAQDWAKTIIALTNPLVIPFGVDGIKTPYGGFLDVDAAITVVLVLGAEWALSGIRTRA